MKRIDLTDKQLDTLIEVVDMELDICIDSLRDEAPEDRAEAQVWIDDLTDLFEHVKSTVTDTNDEGDADAGQG